MLCKSPLYYTLYMQAAILGPNQYLECIKYSKVLKICERNECHYPPQQPIHAQWYESCAYIVPRAKLYHVYSR